MNFKERLQEAEDDLRQLRLDAQMAAAEVASCAIETVARVFGGMENATPKATNPAWKLDELCERIKSKLRERDAFAQILKETAST